MDCMKNLGAKLFIIFMIGLGIFTIKVNAAEADIEATEVDMLGAGEGTDIIAITEEVTVSAETTGLGDTTNTVESVLPKAGISTVLEDGIVNEAEETVESVLPKAGFTILGGDDGSLEEIKLQELAKAEQAQQEAEEEAEKFQDDPAYLDMMSDLEKLARLIQAEGGVSFEDKVAVGLTALHRIDNEKFPNTLKGNIEMPNQYAKLSSGTILEENMQAAEYAMQLWESGMSYAYLPHQYIYFTGDGTGKKNKFHDYHGHYYVLPEINIEPDSPEPELEPEVEPEVVEATLEAKPAEPAENLLSKAEEEPEPKPEMPLTKSEQKLVDNAETPIEVPTESSELSEPAESLAVEPVTGKVIIK